MFKSIKLFAEQFIQIDDVKRNLNTFGYTHTPRVYKEGEYSHRGGILDIYPTNFDCPIRIDLDDSKIRSIFSVNLKTGDCIWRHNCRIVFDPPGAP